ncbi:MAG TPA: DNA translocase FtsK 4TM domain-containing protein [Candidatus Binatia bacterium]|nr:DNA translocase FtsK 4TM domain-containing protein [Candidatus Binatia bacterium]
MAKSRRNVEEASRIVYEVEGIVCAAVAAVLALSFVSYVPDLPGRNQVGPLGHWLANLLVEAFGLAAYLFPAVLGLGAMALFANVAGMTSPVRMLGAFALLIEAAVALGLFRTGVPSERAGGWVGGFLATVMRDALGASGSTVVLGAVGLLVWLMVTATPLATVAGAVKGRTSGVFGVAGTRVAEFFSALLRRGWAALPRLRRAPEIATDAKSPRKRAKVEAEDPPMVFGDNDVAPASARVEPLVQISRPEPKSAKKSGKETSQEEFSFALECDDYKLPPARLLGKSDDPTEYADEKTLVAQSKVLEQKLATFGVSGRVVAVRPGPVITTFEFEPDAGIKVSRVVNLCDDLTMALRAHGVRIVAPIPGKNVVGIEVSNRNRAIVGLRDLIDSDDFRRSRSALTLALGRNTTGASSFADLAKMPHLLMAGATGTGKSVALNAMIISMLYKATPRDVRFIMIDPKMLELALYEGIPHLLVPVVTDVRKAAAALANVMREMDRRFERMKDLQVRSVDDYNARVAEMDDEDDDELEEDEDIEIDEEELEEEEEVEEDGDEDEESDEDAEYEEDEEEIEEADEEAASDEDEGYDEDAEAEESDDEEDASAGTAAAEKPKHEHLPRIVVIVDELADLMMTVGRDVEQSITRLAQKARAAGIHLIVATQRPSVDVITGLIKANFPSRVSFKVTARPDSRTILDSIGAERLLGNGDMLYMAPGTSFMQRLHGAYITDREITEIVKFLKKQGEPEYMMDLLDAPSPEGEGENGEDLNDELYDKAVDLVIEHGQGSTSWVQRKLNIGYNRAARMMEEMERQGVVGPADGARPRKVLVGPHAGL